MRKLLIIALPSLLLLAACSSEPAELPPPVDVGTDAPPVASTPPTEAPPTYPEGTTVINGCPITPQAECVEADLSRAVIPTMDMHDADLTGANISGADLRKVNFSGATLVKANLRNSDLTDADLSGADLEGAILRFTNVTGANLEGANLQPAQLDSLQLCRTIRPDGRRDDSDCPENPGSEPTDSVGPTIVSFKLPRSVACTGTNTTVSIDARWEVKKAKTVTFEENGKPFPGEQTFSKTGEDVFEYPCKKEKVTYTLVAADADGTESQSTVTVKRAA